MKIGIHIFFCNWIRWKWGIIRVINCLIINIWVFLKRDFLVGGKRIKKWDIGVKFGQSVIKNGLPFFHVVFGLNLASSFFGTFHSRWRENPKIQKEAIWIVTKSWSIRCFRVWQCLAFWMNAVKFLSLKFRLYIPSFFKFESNSI